ncbi:hypothetical protein DPMN_059129 [Dreissena polymorpha]|uniref:Mitochondrial import receptor subunit TOM7 homolog n=1 Tax=Dreissena polymorpha TaxID=45954 RepID=A0A9D4C3F2_DREPO|nr:hypothetical protein DPMN_059129 [Dreissena polymorpha]
MTKLTPETKQRISKLVGIAKTTFRYGFIPFVIYLGFKQGPDEGMPEMTVLSILW